MRSSSSPEHTADEFARMTFVLRVFAIFLTIVSLTDAAQRVPGVMVGLLVGTFVSFAPVRWWKTVAPTLNAHPAIFAVDVGLSCTLLMLAGPSGPFFVYTLATAMLAGILYGSFGSVFFSVALSGGYGVALSLWHVEYSFMTFIGLPSMYFVLGLGAAHIMRAYRVQARDAVRLAEGASKQAASRERARLARELHDSVTKTVTGLALQASTLCKRLADEESVALPLAERLTAAAKQATRESREALVTLRAGTGTMPFPGVLEDVLTEIGEDAGVAIEGRSLQEAAIEAPIVRFEVVRMVTEALRNAVAHAGTEDIHVAASSTPEEIEIVVRDHGCGFDPEAASAGGHFGLTGMRERAEQFGGSVEIDSAPGRGTTVTIRVPRSPDPERTTASANVGQVVPA